LFLRKGTQDVIERASVDDVQDLLDVINRTNRAAYRHLIPPAEYRDPFTTREDLVARMDRTAFYLYRDGERVVGVAALCVRGADAGKVRCVYVLPSHQRRGIGSALMCHIEREAARLGLDRLYLKAVAAAQGAIQFYRGLGYHARERLARSGGDVIVMEKHLSPRPLPAEKLGQQKVSRQ